MKLNWNSQGVAGSKLKNHRYNVYEMIHISTADIYEGDM